MDKPQAVKMALLNFNLSLSEKCREASPSGDFARMMPFLLMPDTCQFGRSRNVQLSHTTEAGGLRDVTTT